eukprot:gene43111-53510_t
MKPLTLARLEESLNENSNYKCVNEVIAADLPSDLKRELKTLSHEVAGALMFDLGLDPSSSLFALGKTSSLVGHNLLPILENCAKLRASGLEAAASGATRHEQGLRVRMSLMKQHRQEERLNARPATLILVDRCEDLSTSSSHSGQFPLAHRITSTLKYCESGQHRNCDGAREDNLCDVNITPLSLQTNIAPDSFPLVSSANDVSRTQRERLQLPMSGVSNLSVQLAPTLCYRYANDSFVAKE